MADESETPLIVICSDVFSVNGAKVEARSDNRTLNIKIPCPDAPIVRQAGTDGTPSRVRVSLPIGDPDGNPSEDYEIVCSSAKFAPNDG